MLKDAPRACEAVDVVLDNFNVHVPIPSKVPPAGTERERVQREREILGLKHDSQGERHRHPQSRFALFNVAGAVPGHPPLIWPTDYRRWTRPRTCTARRTSGCSQRTSPRRRRTRSACAGVRATARGDGKAVQYSTATVKKHLQNFDILIEKHGEALKHPPRSTHGDSAEGHLRFLGDRLLSLLSGTEGAFVAHPAVLAVPVGSAQLAAVRHVLAVHGLAVESAPCSQAPKVNVLPIIATKGGRGGKGKVIACPIYKRMNTLTAYELSARAREGCSGRLDRVPLALSELSCTFRVALSELHFQSCTFQTWLLHFQS